MTNELSSAPCGRRGNPFSRSPSRAPGRSLSEREGGSFLPPLPHVIFLSLSHRQSAWRRRRDRDKVEARSCRSAPSRYHSRSVPVLHFRLSPGTWAARRELQARNKRINLYPRGGKEERRAPTRHLSFHRSLRSREGAS